jgi:hypothetical protein
MAKPEKKATKAVRIDIDRISKKKHKPKLSASALIIVLTVVILVLAVINVYLSGQINSLIKARAEELEELAKPAMLTLVAIEDPDCDNCYDISPIIEQVKSGNVEFSAEQTLSIDDETAQDLISKYGIERIPTIIVAGEVDKADSLRGLDEVDGAYVFLDVPPPFTDAQTGDVKGLVTLTLIVDESCSQCPDFSQIASQLSQAGIAIAEDFTYDITSPNAQALIEKYSITKAPTMLLSSDVSVYEDFVEAWSQLGSVEDDGTLVLRTINPPYVDLETNTLEGLVDITYLVDESCEECYDVHSHDPILARFQVFMGKNETIDVSSEQGQGLINKYNISLVPTILLSPEAKLYQTLVNVWPSVGTVEEDGVFVFRKVEVMRGTYKDRESGEIVAALQAGKE